jgi:hypothetical protein
MGSGSGSGSGSGGTGTAGSGSGGSATGGSGSGSGSGTGGSVDPCALKCNLHLFCGPRPEDHPVNDHESSLVFDACPVGEHCNECGCCEGPGEFTQVPQ